CGRAVIVSALPSALEWVEPGQCGQVVPPRDVERLAQAMLTYAREPQLRLRHGDAALAIARRHFDFDANLACVAALFERLVSGVGKWPRHVSLPVLQGRGGDA
ncbi:MAG: glycosyltransferase, partial [Candidatus Krumholzibacteria bacterium]|nr:glycosyltransferase [Candidatus Krumholzibacteria bacterium]